MIKAVVFDMDDTLINWHGMEVSWHQFNQPMVENVRQYLLNQGYAVPDETLFYRTVHQHIIADWRQAKATWAGAKLSRCLRAGLQEMAVPVEKLDMEQLMRLYNWGPAPGVKPFPDAEEILGWLREEGYKIGLITNSFQPMWMRDIELRHFDLLDYFDARLTSGDAGYMKPHPRIYRHLLAELEIEPGEAVYVGDRPYNDIQGANLTGMTSVLMKPDYLNHPLDGHIPDYTITTLSGLRSVLAALK